MTMTIRWPAALLQALLLTVLLAMAVGTGAQSLIDPTRPPSAATNASTAMPGRSDGAARAASAASAALASAAPQLQAIQMPREGGASAIVNGQVVRTGERVGEHTVAAIDATSITLRSARGTTQVLSLLSGVTKTASSVAPDAAPDTSTALAAGSRKDIR
jgi:hypothetical protein